MIILLVTWHMALHLMQHGWWCTRLHPGRFACTRAAPRGVLIRHVPYRAMYRLIRHGFECIRSGGRWWCAPGQIPR